MDIAATLQALQSIVDRAAPVTKKEAGYASREATTILNSVRTFADELLGYLEEAEACATNLEDADADDREDAHDQLVSAAGDLREHLVPDPVPATIG